MLSLDQAIPALAAGLLPPSRFARRRSLILKMTLLLEMPVFALGGYRAPMRLAEGTQGRALVVGFRLLMGSFGIGGFISSLARPLFGPDRWPYVLAWIAVRLQANNDYCQLQQYALEDTTLVRAVYRFISRVATFGLVQPSVVSPQRACAASMNYLTIAIGLVIPQLYVEVLGERPVVGRQLHGLGMTWGACPPSAAPHLPKPPHLNQGGV